MAAINALSIDVEDYWSIFHRDWLGQDIKPTQAVVKNTEWFLKVLSDHNVQATFFILGEVAKKFPSLIKEIAEQGHEIGSHGFSHKQIFKLNREQFRKEISESKKLLEDITGLIVRGHRAPAFSVVPDTQWALETLAEEGFEYDSSVFPIAGSRYGWPGFSKDICKVDLPSGRSIIEVPMATVTVLGKTLPAAGGGYIRHFPYWVTKWAVRHIQKTRPVIVYMHPYEIDVGEQHFETQGLSRQEKRTAIMQHRMQMRNRKTVSKKLFRLLDECEFTTIRRVIEETLVVPG